MSHSDSRLSFETRLIHAPGSESQPAAVPAIHRATVWRVGQEDLESVDGQYESLRYPRYNDGPNPIEVGAHLADLENAEKGMVASSGMAAIAAALLSNLDKGDHVLLSKDLYGGTFKLVTKRFPKLGIEHDFIDPNAPDTWKGALRDTTRVIYVETLGNPLVTMPDLKAVAAFAQQYGLVSLIDNTFATPIGFRPMDHGFDLVLHSATKYLNGHSDVLAGAVVGSAEAMARVDAHMCIFGGTLDVQSAYLLQRGMRTLDLRFRRQCTNAMALAQFLESHPKVDRVSYPGLSSHPQHQRARELMDGLFGGMLAFEVQGGWQGARRVLQRVRLVCHAASLGGVETLVVSPPKSSHAALPAEVRRGYGITDGLLRVSVGIENVEDVIADFKQALD